MVTYTYGSRLAFVRPRNFPIEISRPRKPFKTRDFPPYNKRAPFLRPAVEFETVMATYHVLRL